MVYGGLISCLYAILKLKEREYGKKLMMQDKRTDIFNKWFDDLPINVQLKISDHIARVVSGNILSLNSLREGISEIRVNYQKGYRIFCTVLRNKTLLILLSGGIKSGNGKNQDRDIERAIGIRNYLRERGVI
jgi:putative addiction module killer protein